MLEYNVRGREACVEMVAKEKSLIMSTVSHELTKKLELSLMGKTSAQDCLYDFFWQTLSLTCALSPSWSSFDRSAKTQNHRLRAFDRVPARKRRCMKSRKLIGQEVEMLRVRIWAGAGKAQG